MNSEGKNGILKPNDFGSLSEYCSPVSIRYLEDSLGRLEKGQDPTPSFNLYNHRDQELIFKDILDILGRSSLAEWLIEYETSRLTKVGRQGGIPKWSDLEPLFLLYKTNPKEVKYIDNDILDEMKRQYRKLHCREKGVKDTLAHLIRTNKIETRAAGWSTFELKKTDPTAQKIALKYAMTGIWKHGVGYVFARYNKLKLRLFMPMPYSLMIVQAKYFIDFLGQIQRSIEESRSKSDFVMWADKVGFDNCFDIMGEEVNSSGLKSDETLVYFSNDFEKMDTYTGPSQYKNIFIPIIQAAYGNQNKDQIYEAMIATTTMDIISPSGTMTDYHGTASGAEVTNGGESTCNDYFQRRFLKILRSILATGWRVITRRFNGDDSAFIFAITISLEEFKEACNKALAQACEETGFVVQFDKLDYSDKFGRYCQNVYYYDRDKRKLIWFYPAVLAMNSILNPEHQYKKKDWDKDYRDLDIIEKLDNLRYHPCYVDIVKYVMAGLKYPLLGNSEVETARILSKYESYREHQSLGERYNRQDYDISKSPTVKLVLSLRE